MHPTTMPRARRADSRAPDLSRPNEGLQLRESRKSLDRRDALDVERAQHLERRLGSGSRRIRNEEAELLVVLLSPNLRARSVGKRRGAFEAVEDCLCAREHRFGKTREPRARDAVTSRGRAALHFVEED